MGLSSLLTLAMSKKYTEESLVGVGALKGSPCTIKEIVEKDGVNNVIFEWTATDGTIRTASMVVENGIDGKNGKDGFSPVVQENQDNSTSTYKLDITTSNGTFTTPNLKGADGSSGGGTSSLIWGTFS